MQSHVSSHNYLFLFSDCSTEFNLGQAASLRKNGERSIILKKVSG